MKNLWKYLVGILSFAVTLKLMYSTDIQTISNSGKSGKSVKFKKDDGTVNKSAGSMKSDVTIGVKVVTENGARNKSGAKNNSMYMCPEESDCGKLQKLLKDKWNATKPRAAVYILSRASDAPDLKKTLRNLETNFLAKYNYPVIIFYEADFIPLISEIRNSTNAAIFFQEVHFEAPPLHPSARGIECGGKALGYHHMCRFHSKVIYELPIMKNLEYYLRLDAHSYVNKPVSYDFFKYMRDNKLLYMYPCVRPDQLRCVRYLWDAAKLYLQVKHIQPHFFNKMDGLKMFYNNFEVANINFFRSLPYQNYINYIDQLGGIFYHRWGDAPIKSIGVSILMPENKTRHAYDISYSHRNEVLTRGVSQKPGSNMC